MMGRLVPTCVHVAAKRGFIRTASQSLATTIPLGAVTGAALSATDPVTVAWAMAAAAVSSIGAGTVSYLSILSRGIPEDYQPDVGASAAITHEQTLEHLAETTERSQHLGREN